MHESLQCQGIETTLEKTAAGALAQGLQQAIESGLPEPAVSGRALVSRGELAKPGIEFEISKVADSGNYALRFPIGGRSQDLRRSNELDTWPKFLKAHGCGFYSTSEILPDTPEVLPRQDPDFRGRLLLREAPGEIPEGDPPMPRVEPVGERTADSA
jgi:hypothetical protein